MPVGVKRGAALGVEFPSLDVLVLSAGELATPASIRFAIWDASTEEKLLEPVRVHPAAPAESEALDLDASRVSLGRHAAIWTVPADAALGRHEVEWIVELTTGGPVVSWRVPFDVLPGVVGGGMFSAYALPSDMRAEGFASTDASDARLQVALRRATQDVERYTRRTFGPRWIAARFDSPHSRSLRFGDPILAIESIRFEGNAEPIDPERYVVYNRHVREALFSPDDRNDPRVEWEDHPRRSYGVVHRYEREWGDSRQDLFVRGWFGYTDPDGSFVGAVPEPIRIATMLLAARHLPTMTSADKTDAIDGHLIMSETTRDQSYTKGQDARDGYAEFTGDPHIDEILAGFVAPIFLGSPKRPR